MRVSVHDLAKMGEHEGEGEVGDILGQHVGRVRDAHASRACLRQIDRIDADAIAGDDFELRALVDQRGRRAELAPRRDGPRLRRGLFEKRILVGGQPELAEVVIALHRLHVPLRIGAGDEDRWASTFPLSPFS